MIEKKTKYEKGMIPARENETNHWCNIKNNCPVRNRETNDSKLNQNLREKSLTFIGMCFLKCVSNALYWFLCFFYHFCVKQLTIFEQTVVAASDFKNCTMVHYDIVRVSSR